MQQESPTLPLRRILLGVTGGIAAYKAADLVRRLRDAGCDVQVVMTDAAAQFVTPMTFQALSGRPVRTSLWDESAEAAMGHIELARWPDAVVVAPASADFLARLAHGMAPDLLSTLCLATDKPVIVAPAMNRLMWANAATRDNLAILRRRGVRVLGPGSGSQACGEVGEGRMVEPADIVAALDAGATGGALAGLHAVVTAGPTREPVDPVRVLTNRSSGKQGFAIAAALAARGAKVTLIAGPVALDTPAGVQRTDVETAQQMLDAALAAAADADLFVATAAVADYRPAAPEGHKIKKRAGNLSLALERTPDVLDSVRARFADLYVVGFAAETQDLETHARDKLARKKLDLICANLVGNGRAFDRDDNDITVFWNGGSTPLGNGSKIQLAERLADLIAQRLPARQAL